MTTADSGHMFTTPYNVVAGFRSRQQAEAAARRLASAGLPRTSVEVGTGSDMGGAVETAELRAEMQDELDHSWAGVTGRQTEGAAVGTITFAIGGLIVGLLAGFVANLGLALEMSLAGTMLIGGVLGLIGGATAGFVAGGGIAPRATSGPPAAFNGPRLAAERDVLVAVHASEPETAEQAAKLLRDDLHADPVHLVDADGTPLPPQHGHPRPADPTNYWWRQAGEG